MAKEKGEKWYSTGEEGKNKAKQVDEDAKTRQKQRGAAMRFWVEEDSSAKVTFLDTPNFFLHEHSLKIGQSFRNYFTCIKEFDTCPLCEAGFVPSYIVAATIINHKKWKDKNGVEHTNQKQLAVFKGKARNAILRKIEKQEGDLARCVFEMTRGTTKGECSTGEDFDFLKRLSTKDIKLFVPAGEDVEEWLKPLDYRKIFAPKEADELRKIVGTVAPVGSSEEEKKNGDSDGDEDEGSKSKSKSKDKKKDKDEDSDSDSAPKSIDDLL